MKTKVLIVVLVVIAVGLCIGLVSIKQEAEQQHKDDLERYAAASNNWADATNKLQEQLQVNETQLKDMTNLSEKYSKLSNDLVQVTENLTKSQAEVKMQKEEVAKRDAKIGQLETEKADRDKQLADAASKVADLEMKIADIQQKLTSSEGDKVFLTKELNRLMAQKEDLERQFNDIDVLRAQVRKVKAEIVAARRLQWSREGLLANTGERGSQRLMQGSPGTKIQPGRPTAADLSVEVNSDGSVRIIPPITNSPSSGR